MFKKIFMLMVTIFIIGLLFSCQSLNRYPDKEGVLLRNGSFENGFGRPVGWWKVTSQNRTEWSKNQSYTAERSIAIKSFKAKDEFSFWAQTIKADSILGEKPILKVFIKILSCKYLAYIIYNFSVITNIYKIKYKIYTKCQY